MRAPSDGFSIPTPVGNSIIVSAAGHAYAIDQATGGVNHFHSSNIFGGGGGDTVAFDAARSQFYVLDYYDGAAARYPHRLPLHRQLEHYRGLAQDRPGHRWQSGVAIGPDGTVYSLDRTTLTGRDPATGDVTRMLTGQHFAAGARPPP